MIFCRYWLSISIQTITDQRFFVNKYYRTWYMLANTTFYTFLAFMMRLAIELFINKNKQKEILLQKKNSELALLKAQIDPHFLFNTLNNIYSLSLNKPDKAPDAIIKLSSMLRYTTKEMENNLVLLKEEIEFIRSFMSLQKIRISNPDQIQLTITGDHQNKWIAPMLLIPFIENAFKHGTKINTKGVQVTIETTAFFLILQVENYYEPRQKDSSNIGIKNVRKRLEILYPNRYELHIKPQENENRYLVRLKLMF